MRTKIFCFIFTTRILLGKVGSQHTCVEFIELNWVLVLSWKSIPGNLSESPLFWHTGPFSPPELCSVLLFWPSAFIPFLITNASCYSRSLSKSLICFLQNIFTLCCIICFLRKAFISIMSLSFFEYPLPVRHIGCCWQPCLVCHVIWLWNNFHSLPSLLYWIILFTLQVLLAQLDWSHSTYIVLKFFFQDGLEVREGGWGRMRIKHSNYMVNSGNSS